MLSVRKVRLISAIILVCAIFLPLSECSQRDNHPPPIAKSIFEQFFPQTNTDFSYQYGYENIGFSLGGAITTLAFTWPLIFVLFIRRRFGFRSRLSLQLLELLLCVGTIYLLNALTLRGFGGRWLYGAYVGVVAVTAFTGAGLASWFVRIEKAVEEEPDQAMQRNDEKD